MTLRNSSLLTDIAVCALAIIFSIPISLIIIFIILFTKESKYDR